MTIPDQYFIVMFLLDLRAYIDVEKICKDWSVWMSFLPLYMIFTHINLVGLTNRKWLFKKEEMGHDVTLLVNMGMGR